MVGTFERDEERCHHYAAFASHLGRQAFDYIYWFLFGLVIMMLFLASWKYSRDFEAAQKFESGSRHYRNRMKKCMLICSIYASISVVAVVMEVYALMALQFCDGEDLMSLYWSTWTMMQVGSLIAILGILLSVFNGLRGNKNPPWALALGTPVLVVAGIGHAFHGAMRKRVQRVRSMSRGRSRAYSVSSSVNRLAGISMGDLPMSREETIRVEESEKEDTDFRAKLVGYTPEGGPILQFYDDPGSFKTDRGTVLGKNGAGQVLVAFRKEMTTINDSPPAVGEVPTPTPTPSVIVTTPQIPQAQTPVIPTPRPAVVRIASPPPRVPSPRSSQRGLPPPSS